jgi:hypothetical protein
LNEEPRKDDGFFLGEEERNKIVEYFVPDFMKIVFYLSNNVR